MTPIRFSRVLPGAILLCGTAISHAEQITAAPATARGVVFLDENNDHIRQETEQGLPGVLVTNGQDVVKTDEHGAYSIPLVNRIDTTISVVDPSGYSSPVDEMGIPRFYYMHKPEGSPDKAFLYAGVDPTGELPESVDFPLRRDDTGDRFDVLLVADPQPYNPGEVSFYGRDVITEIRDVDAAFAIALGDLVGDDLSLYSIYNEMNALSGHVWRNVYGNHDMNYMSPNDALADETFEAVFGPADYAFYRGEALFIVLDNVLWNGFDGFRADGKPRRGNYTGDFSERQVRFVRNLLDQTPEDTLIVLSMHIPVMYDEPGKNITGLESMLEALSSHPNTLSLSGHTHKQRHEYFGSDTGYRSVGGGEHHHYNVGTASGTWWRGTSTERGIPHAMMRDGTPNGYAVLSIDGNAYSLRYKAAGYPESYQMNVQVPDESAGGGTITANVFNGCERTLVVYRVGDEGAWQEMQRTDMPDPTYTMIREAETEDGRKTRLSKPDLSTHVWKGELPGTLPAGTTWITVRATDPYGAQHETRVPVRNPERRAAETVGAPQASK